MFNFTTKVSLNSHLQQYCKNQTIGFVPTMGALHSGHLALVKQSLIENYATVVSIFVNPTQFNNVEDLNTYPRTIDKDIAILQNLSDDIILFSPSVSEIYEDKIASQHFDYDGLEHQMEGKHRPGHFDGVGTVVKKLFEIVTPTKAYFGEKDFQQLQIIKKMVEKCKLNVTIVGCPIFRESSGLAMSSRNERLSANDKMAAKIIYETLVEAKKMFGTKSALDVSQFVEQKFLSVEGFRLEYFEIAFEKSLLPCSEKIAGEKCRGFIAVFCGDVRLIDTMRF